jgi:hypothetical protein
VTHKKLTKKINLNLRKAHDSKAAMNMSCEELTCKHIKPAEIITLKKPWMLKPTTINHFTGKPL